MSQIHLQDAWKVLIQTLDPINVGRRNVPSPSIGLLGLLASPANAAASQVKLGNVRAIEQGNGKVYKVSRRFFPRLGEQTEDFEIQYCPSGGDSQSIYADEVEIKHTHTSPVIEVDDALMRCILEGKMDYQSTFLNETIRVYLNRLGRKVATKVGEEFVGVHVPCDCNDAPILSRDLPLYKADGQGINPTGQAILQRDLLEAELVDPFILIGNTILQNYREFHSLQTGNDLGVDASLLDINNAIFYDTNIFSDPFEVLAMAPGALQLITYAKNKGEFAYSDQFDDHMRTTVIDPFFGLEHDVYMNWIKCGEEVKLTIQLSIRWDIVGVPSCWSEDCRFANVTDVFKYKVVCEDTGVCDIPPNCGDQVASGPETDEFCSSAEECPISCAAGFGSDCQEYALHLSTALTATDIIAFNVNGGLNINLSQSYDLTDATQAAAFIAEMKVELGKIGGVNFTYGSHTGGVTTLGVITDPAITAIELVSAGAADIELAVTIDNFVHVYSTSNASNGATITDLAWVTPNQTFNGAPGVAIPNATTNFYGEYQEYYATVEEGGDFQLTITDSVACADTANATTAECPESFDVPVFVFGDDSDDDVYDDPPETGLTDIKLLVFTDQAKTQFYGEEISDGTGALTFSLPAGTYWVGIDQTYGQAVGRTFTTTDPKMIMIDVAGNVAFGAEWNEVVTGTGYWPVGPAV